MADLTLEVESQAAKAVEPRAESENLRNIRSTHQSVRSPEENNNTNKQQHQQPLENVRTRSCKPSGSLVWTDEAFGSRLPANICDNSVCREACPASEISDTGVAGGRLFNCRWKAPPRHFVNLQLIATPSTFTRRLQLQCFWSRLPTTPTVSLPHPHVRCAFRLQVCRGFVASIADTNHRHFGSALQHDVNLFFFRFSFFSRFLQCFLRLFSGITPPPHQRSVHQQQHNKSQPHAVLAARTPRRA